MNKAQKTHWRTNIPVLLRGRLTAYGQRFIKHLRLRESRDGEPEGKIFIKQPNPRISRLFPESDEA